MLSSPTINTVKTYYESLVSGRQDEAMNEIMSNIRVELKEDSLNSKVDLIPQLLFLNMMGYDTVWADFYLMEVMSIENSYFSKRISYIAASLLWNPGSSVVLLAPNRIYKDILSTNYLVVSSVLSSVSSFMNAQIAEIISSNIIAFFSSSKTIIRQKSISLFYQVCTSYPSCAQNGFMHLRPLLEESSYSIIFPVLSLIHELSIHQPKVFTPLIPKLHKMLCSNYPLWIQLRLIQILTILCEAEPRLPKKLLAPFSTIIESSPYETLILECVYSIIKVPIISNQLLHLATQRMESYLYSSNSTLRFYAFKYFFRLLQMQPKLISSYKELVTECLNSDDDFLRLESLDLLTSLANAKNIDGVVERLFDQLQMCPKQSIRNQLVEKIIFICSKNDYENITDFEWYISILIDIMQEFNISCIQELSNQFLDLAIRVPSTREKLMTEMSMFLGDEFLKDQDTLLLASSYIIGEYSQNSALFSQVLQPLIVNDSLRVQLCCLNSSFKMFLRAESESDIKNMLRLFNLSLPSFLLSQYPEVIDLALSLMKIIEIMKKSDFKSVYNHLSQSILENDESAEIEIPEGLNVPVTFLFEIESDDVFLKKYSGKKLKRNKKHKKHRKEKKSDKLEGFASLDNYSDEYSSDEVDNKSHHSKKVKKPEPMSRACILGQNSSMLIRVTEFYPKKNSNGTLEVEFEITNLSKTLIDSLDISIIKNPNITVIENSPCEPIPIGERISHSIVLGFSLTNIPQTLRLLFIPGNSSSETLETRVKFSPSYFFLPGDPKLLDQARETLQNCETLELPCRSNPRTLLQASINILRSRIIHEGDPHSRTLLSKLSDGSIVYCILRMENGLVNYKLFSLDKTLASSLIRELEMRVRALK